MKLRKMTSEEIEHFEKQKLERLEEELKNYKPPTEEEIKEMHDQEEQNYYVSDMTAEEEVAFEKEVWEAYDLSIIEEIEQQEKIEKDAALGRKFSQGKLLGAKSKSTLHIEELVKSYPNQTAKELFKLANPELLKGMELRTFENHVSKIRNNQK